MNTKQLVEQIVSQVEVAPIGIPFNPTAMCWDDRSLMLKGIPVATVAVHEWERGVYSVWSNLPDADEPTNIKGIANARRAAEKSVVDWFIVMLGT